MSRLYLISNWDQSTSLHWLQKSRAWEYDVWSIYLHELVICFHIFSSQSTIHNHTITKCLTPVPIKITTPLNFFLIFWCVWVNEKIMFDWKNDFGVNEIGNTQINMQPSLSIETSFVYRKSISNIILQFYSNLKFCRFRCSNFIQLFIHFIQTEIIVTLK